MVLLLNIRNARDASEPKEISFMPEFSEFLNLRSEVAEVSHSDDPSNNGHEKQRKNCSVFFQLKSEKSCDDRGGDHLKVIEFGKNQHPKISSLPEIIDH